MVAGVLFRDHLLGFEVAGLLLLAAMVGAVSLVKKDL
jgi:NADH:ubiquinone oxidoreductase subunit 6 (subunit J)